MSNRTLVELNHDIDWTADPEALCAALDGLRSSVPSGPDKFSVLQRYALSRFGIQYIVTRHHSETPLIEFQRARIAELETALQRIAKHWNEFGPECGFDETMHFAGMALAGCDTYEMELERGSNAPTP